jgi:ankyrin repeat protein
MRKNMGHVRWAWVVALLPLWTGCTTIHKAVEKGDLAQADEILQKGIGVDARDPDGRTPLMWAAGNLPVVRYLVEQQGVDVNAKDQNGETALRWAATFGHLAVVKYLVEQGAEVNVRDQAGQTPLKWATAFGHQDVARYLRKMAAAAEPAAPRLDADEGGRLGRAAWQEARAAE